METLMSALDVISASFTVALTTIYSFSVTTQQFHGTPCLFRRYRRRPFLGQCARRTIHLHTSQPYLSLSQILRQRILATRIFIQSLGRELCPICRAQDRRKAVAVRGAIEEHRHQTGGNSKCRNTESDSVRKPELAQRVDVDVVISMIGHLHRVWGGRGRIVRSDMNISAFSQRFIRRSNTYWSAAELTRLMVKFQNISSMTSLTSISKTGLSPRSV